LGAIVQLPVPPWLTGVEQVIVPQYQLQQFSEVITNWNTATHKGGGRRAPRRPGRAAPVRSCPTGQQTNGQMSPDIA
jgi:hypothetical protein